MIIVKKDQTKFIPIWLGDLPLVRHSGKRSASRIQQREDSGQARMTGKRLDVVLAGENASVEILGLVIGKGAEEKELVANITHAAPNTKSDVRVKGVLRGRAKFDFRGNVKIENGAKGSDAYLRSDVLLFDEAKMGDDTPALEILEPDVKAGHAATVGKVDEQMVFYLMSRGLSRKQAEGLIVEGFVGEMADKIRNTKPEIRNKQSLRSLSFRTAGLKL